jgi:hypothetical protein
LDKRPRFTAGAFGFSTTILANRAGKFLALGAKGTIAGRKKCQIFDPLIDVLAKCHKLLDPVDHNISPNGVTHSG